MEKQVGVLIAAPLVVTDVVGDVVGIFYPVRHLGGYLGPDGEILISVLRRFLEYSVLGVVTPAHIVFHLVVASGHRHIMLACGTIGVQQVMIPVIISVVVVQAVILKHDPRTGRILGLVIAPLVQLEQPSVLGGVVEYPALGGMERLVAEHVDYADMLVTGCDVVRVGGRLDPSLTEVVVYRAFSCLSLFGGDEHHTGGSFRAINSTCGSVFQNRHRLDVVRIDLLKRDLHAVRKHQRRTSVHRDAAPDIYGRGTVRTAVAHLDVEGRIRSLEGIRSRDRRPFLKRGAIHYAHGTGQA